MRNLTALSSAMLLFLVGIPLLRSQATPTATPGVYYPGFHLPNVGGSLQYSLSASESVIFGYNGQNGGYGGNTATTNLSGNLAYLSRSEQHPFSLIYSGGTFLSTSKQPTAFFQNLALSQVYKTRTWNFVVSDSISYLPETATVGLSGIPGIGDLGVDPVGGAYGAVQGILTRNGPRIGNYASGSAVRNLTAATSLSLTGFGAFQTFLGDSTDAYGDSVAGLDSRQEGGAVTLNHRIDSRSSVGAGYTYSTSSFSGSQFTFASQQANLLYSRQLSRRLLFNASVGPQWTNNSDQVSSNTSIDVATSIGLAYSARIASASINYSRGTNSGSGVLLGARTDSVGLIAHRELGRNWGASASANYARSASLPGADLVQSSTDTEIAGVQASRNLTRSLSFFSSYTFQRQTTNGALITPVAFVGHSQVLSVGITFSPSSTRLNP